MRSVQFEKFKVVETGTVDLTLFQVDACEVVIGL